MATPPSRHLGRPGHRTTAYDAAKSLAGIRIGNAYGYKQAFRNAIPRDDIDLLHAVLRRTWGELPLVADPTAGGGSIPWAACRLGLPALANDLNGVAASSLKAGVEIPARAGLDLLPELKKWGKELVERIEARLERLLSERSPGKPLPRTFSRTLSRARELDVSSRCSPTSGCARHLARKPPFV